MIGKFLFKFGSILSLSFFMTGILFAATLGTGPAIPYNIHVYDTYGNSYVDHAGTGGCSSGRYALNPNHSKYETIMSILLAAQIAQKNVILRYDGCDANQHGTLIGVYLN